MEVKFTPYPTEILTSDFQIIGELRPRGNPNIFVNDNAYQTIALNEASLKPIMTGARLGPVAATELVIPKVQIHVMVIRNFTAVEAQLLTSIVRVLCFTDTYVIRGNFHAGPETKATDLFFTGAGAFYPATEVEVFPIRPLSTDVSLKADMAYIQRTAVAAYFQEQ